MAFLLLTHWRQQAVHRAVCRRDHCGYLFPEDKDAEQHTMSRHCCMKNCPTQNILGQTLTCASQHTPLMVKVLWLEMWTIRANRLLEIDVGASQMVSRFPLGFAFASVWFGSAPASLPAYFCKNQCYTGRRKIELNLRKEHNWISATYFEGCGEAHPTPRLFRD